MQINRALRLRDFDRAIARLFDLAGPKIERVQRRWNPADGSPVFTRKGRYTSRGWTEWTQGFQYGCQILQFDATGDKAFYELGRSNTLRAMGPHLTHMGVHDHGFNIVSTFGNLRRLALEGRVEESADALDHFALALKVSGAVQAARWTKLKDGTGFIHSFNGPHSLFSDTIRSCRSLVVAHRLGHYLLGEGDQPVSLLGRAIEHMLNTARYNVYFGKRRDRYDVRGRVAHESIFNTVNGEYRCPSTQQGYAPFTTWTRGLAWIMLGYAEQLEFLETLPDDALEPFGGRQTIAGVALEVARNTCDHYIACSAADGIPYWDTGAPGLAHMDRYAERRAEPDNPYEPVDSSAAVIAAQGLLRLGRFLGRTGKGRKYYQAGLTVTKTLFNEPYLSTDQRHEGLILHSVYHRPNNWDYVPKGKKVPQGESSMWGDYHAMELAVYIKREMNEEPYLRFFDV